MSALQVTWFVLVGVLLAGYAVLDGFDLGVGLWHLGAKKDEHRRTLIRAIGPLWDGNEVWLLTGGGAIFAAFPPVYATVFSGFYLALMLVLVGLIFRAVAIEVRSQSEDPGWRSKWDVAFAVGSALPALLFGVAVGNLVRGIALDEKGDYIGGFFALLNPYSLLVGLTGLAMFATHGALFIVARTSGELADQARGWVAKSWVVYLILFVATSSWSLIAYQRGSIVLPLIAAAVALAAIVVVRVFHRSGADMKAFLASAAGIVALLGAVGATLYPSLVPASNDAALSLTIFSSSSSQVTLTAMLVMALIGMPLVLIYTGYVYRTFWSKAESTDGGDQSSGY